jgi:hypothetical protein
VGPSRAAVALAALCAGAALAVAPGAAAADVERVVLIAVPSEVEAAVRAALEPWQVELVVVGGPTPGPSMPRSAGRAERVARRARAGAAVWLADDGSGTALWVYDAESQRTTARKLPGPPPYDEPTATAVALSVKTLLRFSAVAPPSERMQAPAERVEPEPEPEPAPVPPPTATATTAAPRPIALTARAGLRRRDTGVSTVEPRFGLGARARLPVAGLAIALAAELRLGPGESIDDARFAGHFSDLAIGARAGVELPLGRLRLTPSVGGGVHLTAIGGSLAGGAAASKSRTNPSLDAAALLSADVGRGLLVGLELEGGYHLRRQRYTVGGEPVFEVPALEAEVSVVVAVPLP